MASLALLQLWETIRKDFEKVWALLPEQTAETKSVVDRLEEYLDHNELELALHELEALGDGNAPVPEEYWSLLASAANRMGLVRDANRLIQRSIRD